jgi:hypothetical protein
VPPHRQGMGPPARGTTHSALWLRGLLGPVSRFPRAEIPSGLDPNHSKCELAFFDPCHGTHSDRSPSLIGLAFPSESCQGQILRLTHLVFFPLATDMRIVPLWEAMRDGQRQPCSRRKTCIRRQRRAKRDRRRCGRRRRVGRNGERKGDEGNRARRLFGGTAGNGS